METGSMTSRRKLAAAALAAAALAAGPVLTGCTVGGAGQPVPTWVPKPEGLPPVAEPQPQLPGAAIPGPIGPDGQPGPGQGSRPSPGSPDDPSVLASGLHEPWGLAVLPDGNAVVGERPTGRVLLVHGNRTPPQKVQTIDGLDTTGDGGLLGITLSPAYQEDRLIFAYLTTRTDNRVVKFEMGSPPTPVLTGIPKGRTGNGGRIAFGPDGMLYIGTGDTGRPQLARDPRSMAGKILRVTEFGEPAPGNPTPGSRVYTSGNGNVSGLCWTEDRVMFDLENAGDTAELNRISAGRNYGWPTGYGPARRRAGPELTVQTGVGPVGGCAIIRVGLFMATLPGKRLLAVSLDANAEPRDVRPLLEGSYGRLRTVEAGPVGTLWLTTANRDGQGRPVPADDRVIRIDPPDFTTSPV
jgi:glucose/arabinose dehydrogenase